MPPKSVFRQPGVRHFQLVHRSQRDPLIHDSEASQHVLKPFERENAKGKSRAELETIISPDDLAHDLNRANIGEAALHDIYYDDTEYDYMQHLRPVGQREEGVEGFLLEAPSSAQKSKRKGGAKDNTIFLELPPEALPSDLELPRDYDAEQAIPTFLSGLQPDMDPHLRQTLEALEDDAFVDDGLTDDFFGQLIADGEREIHEEFDFEFHENGNDGELIVDTADSGAEDSGWEVRYTRFKKNQDMSNASAGSESGLGDDARSEACDTVGRLPELAVIGGKRRHRGASDASGYSMSSSSMFRNEGLRLLDERFDQIEKEYETDEEKDDQDDGQDDDTPQLITSREDFNAIMDDFLDNYEIVGRKMRPVLQGETGPDKLDTMRRAMGVDERVRVGREDEGDHDKGYTVNVFDEDEGNERWDCETILSTYSNVENHPRLIRAREIKQRQQIYLDPLTGLPSTRKVTKLTRATKVPESTKTSPQPDTVVSQALRVVVGRPRDETKEDKKVRKQAVKAERQARRIDKKVTKEQFSSERKQLLASSRDKIGIRKL